jgi:hypothetical protein
MFYVLCAAVKTLDLYWSHLYNMQLINWLWFLRSKAHEKYSNVDISITRHCIRITFCQFVCTALLPSAFLRKTYIFSKHIVVIILIRRPFFDKPMDYSGSTALYTLGLSSLLGWSTPKYLAFNQVCNLIGSLLQVGLILSSWKNRV